MPERTERTEQRAARAHPPRAGLQERGEGDAAQVAEGAQRVLQGRGPAERRRLMLRSRALSLVLAGAVPSSPYPREQIKKCTQMKRRRISMSCVASHSSEAVRCTRS